jgi:hypothetical protein
MGMPLPGTESMNREGIFFKHSVTFFESDTVGQNR